MSRNSELCECIQCPGAGCQRTVTLVQPNESRSPRNCSEACGCDAAEQGCLCRR